MVYIIFILHLSVLGIVLAVIGTFSRTTVQLLLVVVGIVFLQGLLLISIGSSMIGSYLMIIYIGAIVILFAFCILFINSKELTESNTGIMKKLSSLLLALVFWEIISGYVSTIPFSSSLESNFLSSSEVNYMLYIGRLVFGELLIPLLLMLGILILGLFITIKIIKNKC